MSASLGFPLRYVLPTTDLSLSVTLRMVVVVDDQGGHLEPEVSASLAAPWHPDPLTSARRVSGGSDDPLDGSVPASTVPGSLRRAFDRSHPRTAALICDLSARSEQYLAGLRMGEEPAQVVTFGQALAIVHRELAAADRARREWISRQARDADSVEMALSAKDMITLDAPAFTLPGDTEIPAGRAHDLAARFGLLLALVNEGAPASAAKGSRVAGASATVAVYRSRPDGWPGQETRTDPRPDWVRDEALSRLRLADAGDPGAEVPQPRVSPAAEKLIAPLLGRPMTVDPHIEAATRAARVQIELLDASDEYSRIAATQYRAEEIAALQHLMRLAYMPRQRSGD
jgi:hypothetical protein